MQGLLRLLPAFLALPVGAAAPVLAQSVPIAITGVTVIDGTGAPARANVTVVVHRGTILAVLEGNRRTGGAEIIVDGQGKFLIPGLWDLHVHLTNPGAHALPLFIANGVTGVRDMGGDWRTIRALRDEVNAGSRLGPRIKAAGPILETPARLARIRRKKPSEKVERSRIAVGESIVARRVVDSLAGEGVDLIKFRTIASREAYAGIAAGARASGLSLAGHGDKLSVEEMIRGGQRTIEHPILWPLQWKPEGERRRLIRSLAKADVAIVPTLVNFHAFFMTPARQAYRLLDDTGSVVDPRRRYVSVRLLRDWREQVEEDIDVRLASLRRSLLRWIYRDATTDLREMHRAGVRILPGTDLTVAFIYPGFSLHDELRYFVEEIGMTPMQAIVSATRWPAEVLGLQDSLGTIQPGRIADMVLLDADPSADIRNTKHIVGVFRRGEYYDREALNRLLQGAESAIKAEHALPSRTGGRLSP